MCDGQIQYFESRNVKRDVAFGIDIRLSVQFIKRAWKCIEWLEQESLR